MKKVIKKTIFNMPDYPFEKDNDMWIVIQEINNIKTYQGYFNYSEAKLYYKREVITGNYDNSFKRWCDSKFKDMVLL
jgi:hypothetical protein